MRSVFFALTALGVMLLAVWAYHENHATQQARAEQRAIEREINALRANIAMQRAEWAYLNRPERLRALVDMNFTRLNLLPMTVEQFGRIDEIVYPERPHGQDAETPPALGAFGLSPEGIAHTAADPATAPDTEADAP